MSRYSRIQTLQSMYNTGLVVVFYHSDSKTVIDVSKACADGGCPLIEFTNRADFAWQVFAELEKECAKNYKEVITGVGSIVDSGTASLYINNGANFIVGPLLNEEVALVCNRRKIPYSPGCGSATEISKAESLGCEIVKVFPGESVGGPSFVKALKGPCPWTSLMPTGGVEPTRESLSAWYKAGISCAGIGSQLVTKELLQAKDYAGITKKVKETISLIQQIKSEL